VIFKILKFFFKKKKKVTKPDIKFSEPDENGIITLLDDKGNLTSLKIQTLPASFAEKLKLVQSGYSEKEADEIIKSNERDKKIEKILNTNKSD